MPVLAIVRALACSLTLAALLVRSTVAAQAQAPRSPSHLELRVSITSLTRYDKAMHVILSNCMGCHSGGIWNWGNFSSEKSWVDAGLVVPGNMASSKITLRIKYGKEDNSLSAEDMPFGVGLSLWNNFSESDYAIIRDWIMNMSPTGGTENNPGQGVLTSGSAYRATVDFIRLGDRFFVDSVLKEIYGSLAAPVTRDMVFTRVGFFGGPCDHKEFYTYSDPDSDSYPQSNPLKINKLNCQDADLDDDHISLTPQSSALRAGLLSKACLSINAIDGAIQYAVQNSGGAVTNWPMNSDLEHAYQRFYPGRAIPLEIQNSLANVVAAAKTNFPSAPLEAWRYLFLTLCNSPQWQQP